MTTDIVEKTDQYGAMLEAALEAADPAAGAESPLADAGEECLEMAAAYLHDGRHFAAQEDWPNALAAFAYGHGWLDAGARVGILAVPREGTLFTI